MNNPNFIGDLLGSMLKEGKRRLLPLATLFSVVALIGLGLALLAPKRWDAQSVVVFEASNIIKPLMEGRAVTTSIADQTALVTQIVMGRKIQRELLAFAGWAKPKMSPQDEERLIFKLRSHIQIDTPREGTIRIGYHDSDPKRAYEITKKLTEIYLRESMTLKERESREAFDFIAKRVQEYGDKLTEAHEKLLAYYRGQGTGQPLAASAGGAAAATIPGASDAAAAAGSRQHVSAEELAKLRDEEATLLALLARSKPAAATAAESRQAEEAYRARTIQLQGELDRLLATYTEQHPDVKRVRRDLEMAKEDLHRAEQARVDRETAKANAAALDDDVTRETRLRLEMVQNKLAAATGTHRRSPSGSRTSASTAGAAAAAAAAATDPEMRGVGQDSTLSELLRRYEATRDVYQDLLKRRENARVSMDLDAENRGLTLRVQEPAEMPVTASSLRLLHLTLIALVVAVVVPLVVLVGIVRLDPRVRSPWQIERLARVPLLVSIPYAAPSREKSVARKRERAAALMVAGVFAVYVVVFLVRLKMSS